MAKQNPKRLRKKNDDERIDLEEWGSAGALDGLLSFLNIPPEQAPVNQGRRNVLNLLEQRQHSDRQPLEKDSVPIMEEPVEPPPPPPATVPPDTIPVIDTVSVTDTLSVIDGEPTWIHPKQATGFGNKKLYRCTLAQHGHSHTEEALYQVLWRAGKIEADDTRLSVMGYGQMSKHLRLSFNNTKYACQRLIAKLAIEEVAREVSYERQGKTYRVYSYKAILERRKAAGLEWVIRNKGVEFVKPQARSSAISDTVPVITLPVIDTVSITGRESLSITGRGTLSITGTPLDNSFREVFRKSSSSSDVVSLLQALSDYGQPDDVVARTLLERCRNIEANCTVSEIIHFVHQKGELIRQDRSGRITSPMGFLLAAVPKCFGGETFLLYREEERRRDQEKQAARERQEAEIEQWRTEQERVLSDPNSSEEDKRFARQVLSLD